MKGLLLKDWYLLKSYFKLYGLMLLIFTVLSLFSDNNIFFLIYPCLMVGIIPISLISYDERSKWTIYSSTMPYSKKDIVSEKYLIGIILNLIIILFSSLTQSIKMISNSTFSLSNLFSIISILLFISLPSSSLALPFIFKLGSEKGRLIIAVSIAVLFSAISIISGIFIMDNGVFFESTPVNIKAFSSLIALLTVAIYFISWRISIKVYEKREL